MMTRDDQIRTTCERLGVPFLPPAPGESKADCCRRRDVMAKACDVARHKRKRASESDFETSQRKKSDAARHRINYHCDRVGANAEVVREARREKRRIQYKALDTERKKELSRQINRKGSERRQKEKMTENTEKEHAYEMFLASTGRFNNIVFNTEKHEIHIYIDEEKRHMLKAYLKAKREKRDEKNEKTRRKYYKYGSGVSYTYDPEKDIYISPKFHPNDLKSLEKERLGYKLCWWEQIESWLENSNYTRSKLNQIQAQFCREWKEFVEKKRDSLGYSFHTWRYYVSNHLIELNEHTNHQKALMEEERRILGIDMEGLTSGPIISSYVSGASWPAVQFKCTEK